MERRREFVLAALTYYQSRLHPFVQSRWAGQQTPSDVWKSRWHINPEEVSRTIAMGTQSAHVLCPLCTLGPCLLPLPMWMQTLSCPDFQRASDFQGAPCRGKLLHATLRKVMSNIRGFRWEGQRTGKCSPLLLSTLKREKDVS